MKERLERTQMLLGEEALCKLEKAHVIIFGIGGVGGYVVEALARSGVGHLTLVDNDRVAESNINRQIVATTQTIDKYKTDVMADRIKSINEEAVVEVHHCFFLPGEPFAGYPFEQYSYIVDAIDTVSAKLELVVQAKKANVPIISCMGTGNKLNPTELEVADIYQTSVCPLAKVMRKELRTRGIKQLKVVYSKEEPGKPIPVREANQQDKPMRRATPGSVSFVPPVAGMIIASEVIKDLIK